MIKRYLNSKSMLLVLLGIFTVTICLQNFIAGMGFELLSLRSVDDFAFQASIHRFFGYKGLELTNMNDYGYGWIYWFPIYLISYPAYLLMVEFGIEWPLLVLPRMQSLFFAVGCSVIAYKIVCKYTKNEWIRVAVVLLLPIYPAGAYWAGRFGTVNQTAFFSMLSVWLIIKHDELDRKKLRSGIMTFAIALATKVSAIVVAPLLVLLVLLRFKWKFGFKNILIWFQEGILAFAVFIVCMSPALALAPINLDRARDSWNILLTFFTNNQGTANIMANFKGMIGMTTWNIFYYFMCAGLIVLAVNEICKRKKIGDYTIFLAGYIIGILYLCGTIPTGSTYVFMYSTAVSFVLPLGILAFELLEKRLLISVASVMCISLQMFYCGNKVLRKGSYNIYEYYQRVNDNEDIKDEIYIIKQLIEDAAGDGEISYIIDYQGPYGFLTSLENNRVIFDAIVWDDLPSWQEMDFEFMVLSKNSAGFKNEEDFESEIQSFDQERRNNAIIDREIRQQLSKNKIAFGYQWDKIYESERLYIFQKVKGE